MQNGTSQEFIALMREALKQARIAGETQEVPIGAVLAHNGEIICRAHNLVEKHTCVNQHAELLVLAGASKMLGNWRLANCILCVTLEPCPMCMAALRLARVSTVIFGASDPRLGACGSRYNLASDEAFGPNPLVTGGVLADECLEVIRTFFKIRRDESKKLRQK